MPVRRSRAWLRVLGFSAVGWVLLALVRTSLRIAAIPRPFATAAAIFGQLLLASLPWLLWAPAIVALAARLSWRRGERLRTAGVHAGLAVALSLVDSLWGWIVLPPAGYPMTLSPGVWYLVRLDQALFLYVCLVGIGVGLRHGRRLDEVLVRSRRLEAQLLQARLHVLALQLHPHFLFNTLNSVSELVHRDAVAARAMLAHLRELLLRSLDAGAVQEVTLRDELALLQPYARIQRMRFADSLDIVVDASPDTLGARVPRLLLQPLVENAIRHGTARRAGPGRVTVRGRSERGRLIIEVEDDGRGLAGGDRREGLGLGNTRARIGQLYGGDARLTLEPASGRGAVARLECPLRTDAAPATGPVEAGEAPASDDASESRGVSRSRLALIAAAAWLAIAVAGAQEDFIAHWLVGTPEPFAAVLRPRLGEALLWLALTPAVVVVAGRLGAAGLGWRALLSAHLAAGLATIALHLWLVRALVSPDMDGTLVATLLVNDLCVYAALAAGAHAWTVRRVAAARRAAAATLDAELAAARLQQLRWRLRPELLFGALDRIGELAETDSERADELTGRLGELLRLMLQSGRSELVPLSRELKFLNAYLQVDGAVRAESTPLLVAIDPAARSAAVPAMLLQPIVEAIGGVGVEISGRLHGDALELVVRSRPSAAEPSAECLLDVRRRLQAMYGEAQRLALHRNAGEVTAMLLIPALPAPRAGRAVA